MGNAGALCYARHMADDESADFASAESVKPEATEKKPVHGGAIRASEEELRSIASPSSTSRAKGAPIGETPPALPGKPCGKKTVKAPKRSPGSACSSHHWDAVDAPPAAPSQLAKSRPSSVASPDLQAAEKLAETVQDLSPATERDVTLHASAGKKPRAEEAPAALPCKKSGKKSVKAVQRDTPAAVPRQRSTAIGKASVVASHEPAEITSQQQTFANAGTILEDSGTANTASVAEMPSAAPCQVTEKKKAAKSTKKSHAPPRSTAKPTAGLHAQASPLATKEPAASSPNVEASAYSSQNAPGEAGLAVAEGFSGEPRRQPTTSKSAESAVSASNLEML